MEPEEMAKNVDACYKNILEKFNPGARQLINAGKSYLKALHGAAAAAKIYLESLSRIAKQAQQGTCGGTADIGIAMQQMIDVQREIQTQQLNTLKAFYVDLIVPLESNIEKDTKVVQTDHKKFNQQYRTQHEVYSKALAMVKKHSKKSSSKTNRTSASYDKEIKHLQSMEEEKAKLDAFCELSLKEAVAKLNSAPLFTWETRAIAQERKRYGFVLERQTSLSKHFLAHYGKGAALLEKHLDGWQETSKAREDLPPCVEFLLGQRDSSANENLYALPRTPVMTLEDDSENLCSASQMRKSHSIDTSYLYEEAQSTFNEAVNPKITSSSNQNNSASGRINTNLCKSKSEYNLAFASPSRSVRSGFGTTTRPKSTAVNGESRRTVRALYAYLSSGEHQINFLEGDLILLLGDDPVSFHSNANGDRNKGWYYGENIRTGKRGWFPLAYTEPVKDTDVDSGLGLRSQLDSGGVMASAAGTNNADTESTTSGNSSASNCSSAGIAPVMQHLPASSVIALNKAAANMRNKPDVQQQPTQASNPASRPTSLLGDRALFSRVPGFGKLRKSRSAFAERILCPATTPSAPGAPQLPGAEYVVGPPAGAAPAAPSAVTTPQQVQSPTSAAATTHQRLLSPTSSPSCGVFSPTKKAPAPPPRLINQAPPIVHQPHQSNASIGIMSDQSLRSSSDSGFANDQQHDRQRPPPAPEVDYSDEESIKLSPRLSDWLLYSSAADLSQEAYNSDGEWNANRPGKGNGQSMTLDRPPRTDDHNGARSGKLSSYPPVLGYLATLTRSKASNEQKRRRHQQQHESTGVAIKRDAEPVNEAAADQLPADRSGVRRLSGLFTKNANAAGQRDKIKSKLTSAPAILKTALFRSRSKDSILMTGDAAESSPSAQHGEAPWQHKSSVPCYVGWRPPMPLPKDALEADAREPAKHGRAETFGRISRRSVIRTESRRSNLGWRKYSSESDLLEASESGYMAIDRCPSMTPALSFFNPLLREAAHGSIGTLRTQFFDEDDETAHTLPRQRLAVQQEQRVHFKLSHTKQVAISKRPPAPLPTEADEERQVPDSCMTFADYSVRLMHLQHHENGQVTPPDAEAERFGPWYDLWRPDPSVRLCEIAQL